MTTTIKDLQNHIKNEWEEIPNLEVRVVVLGFSRGAAIGRHFMNLVPQRFQTSLAPDLKLNSRPLVRTVGILYDTVATSVENELELGISPSTDHLIHIISKGETRRFFEVVKDIDIDFPATRGRYPPELFYTCPRPYIKNSNRLTHIELPGVHSDIGASYKHGIGLYHRVLSEILLSKLGLINKAEYKIFDYPFTQGKHDSRGLYDLFLDKILGNDERGELFQTSVPLDAQEKELLKTRLNSLYGGNNLNTLSLKEISPLVFELVKHGNKIKILGSEDKARYLGKNLIEYSFNEGKTWMQLPLPEKVVDSIPEGLRSKVEFILLIERQLRWPV